MSMAAPNLGDYFQAKARNSAIEVPAGYGFKPYDMDLHLGFLVDVRTGCRVLDKPIVIPSGKLNNIGDLILYAYCSKEGIDSFMSGQTPPILPATTKEPAAFQSLQEIAANFGAKDPQAAKVNSECCICLRVPAELATQGATPGRDIWIVRLDQDQVSPFLQAAKEGNADKVKKLLDVGLTGDLVDEHGVSALMMAAMAGSVDTCQALLSKGGDVNFVEPTSKRTALMFAAQGGHLGVVELLVASSADASKVDDEGQTALMWAAVAGKADVTRRLASIGPKDAKNLQGMTALDLATKIGHTDTIAALQA